MASLSLTEFADRVQRAAVKIREESLNLTKGTSQQILYRVVLTTPIKTGKAKSNWRVSHRNPTRAVIESYGKEVAADMAIMTGLGVIARTQPSQTVVIANNVPYILDLNNGSSSQAPAGFIEDAIMTAQLYVEEHKQDIVKGIFNV